MTVFKRVASAVVFQTIGLDDNRQAFFEMLDSWANELRPTRPDVSGATWESFKTSMYGGDFLFNVSREFVSRCQTPLLVLLGMTVNTCEVEAAPGAEVLQP